MILITLTTPFNPFIKTGRNALRPALLQGRHSAQRAGSHARNRGQVLSGQLDHQSVHGQHGRQPGRGLAKLQSGE